MSTEVKESWGVDGCEGVSSNCEVEKLVKQKLCSRRHLCLVPHRDTSVSGSNGVSVHLCASRTGALPLTTSVLHLALLRGMKYKICSLELLSWWIRPPPRHSSETLWVCSVTAANPSVMNMTHKNVICKKGDSLQEGCSYLMPLLHLLLTWCADAWSCPGISHQDLVGDKGKECLEQELQEDEKGFWQHVELDVVLVLMPLVPMPSRHFLWMTRNLGK